ncbi:hypothetical protein PR048_024534 [Dryococelus australis]|uniref:Uncharacterized protein n=1 Tax=Dryococelus australis TaxID=614101 RepID=A0ABQ9GNT7_9NEOP|nr:hypothetical protein PR048_024534 [Dryococelus australis]
MEATLSLPQQEMERQVQMMERQMQMMGHDGRPWFASLLRNQIRNSNQLRNNLRNRIQLCPSPPRSVPHLAPHSPHIAPHFAPQDSNGDMRISKQDVTLPINIEDEDEDICHESHHGALLHTSVRGLICSKSRAWFSHLNIHLKNRIAYFDLQNSQGTESKNAEVVRVWPENCSSPEICPPEHWFTDPGHLGRRSTSLESRVHIACSGINRKFILVCVALVAVASGQLGCKYPHGGPYIYPSSSQALAASQATNSGGFGNAAAQSLSAAYGDNAFASSLASAESGPAYPPYKFPEYPAYPPYKCPEYPVYHPYKFPEYPAYHPYKSPEYPAYHPYKFPEYPIYTPPKYPAYPLPSYPYPC